MSEMTAVLGQQLPFEFRGVTYVVARRNFAAERAMVCHLEARHYEAIKRHAALMGAGMANQQVAEWTKACGAGHWEYGSQGFSEFYSTPAGIRKAFQIQMREHNPTFTDEVMDAVWEDAEKLKELDEKIDAVNSDPLTRGRQTPPSTPS